MVHGLDILYFFKDKKKSDLLEKIFLPVPLKSPVLVSDETSWSLWVRHTGCAPHGFPGPIPLLSASQYSEPLRGQAPYWP